MKGFWTDKRPNGQPLEGGVCFVTDLEDGTHPIYTYGADQNEVFDKLVRMNANAQAALARRTANPSSTPAQDGSQTRGTAAPVRSISADDIMQATADLSNPAKAGDAVATLLEASTGVDPRRQALEVYGATAMQWQQRNPDFYPHPANIELMTNRVITLTHGKIGSVTFEMLDQVFNDFTARGILAERPAPPPNNPSNPTLENRPGESPAPIVERPRGTRFATGASSLNFGASQTQRPKTPKYSEEDIRTMPESKRRRLLETNDPDYAAACEYHYGQSSRATA